jgi:hypothetical protein
LFSVLHITHDSIWFSVLFGSSAAHQTHNSVWFSVLNSRHTILFGLLNTHILLFGFREGPDTADYAGCGGEARHMKMQVKQAVFGVLFGSWGQTVQVMQAVVMSHLTNSPIATLLVCLLALALALALLGHSPWHEGEAAAGHNEHLVAHRVTRLQPHLVQGLVNQGFIKNSEFILDSVFYGGMVHGLMNSRQ